MNGFAFYEFRRSFFWEMNLQSEMFCAESKLLTDLQQLRRGYLG